MSESRIENGQFSPESVKFEDFNFAMVQWKMETDTTAATKRHSSADVPIIIEGRNFKLGLKKEETYSDDQKSQPNKVEITYKVTAPTSNQALLEGSVDIDFTEKQAIATSNIFPRDQSDALPKGAGRKLYEKILQYLPSLASQYERPFQHVIMYGAALSNLSIERWQKIFGPLLQRYHYQRTLPDYDIWEHTYEPGIKK